jgi:hypothetical protein
MQHGVCVEIIVCHVSKRGTCHVYRHVVYLRININSVLVLNLDFLHSATFILFYIHIFTATITKTSKDNFGILLN